MEGWLEQRVKRKMREQAELRVCISPHPVLVKVPQTDKHIHQFFPWLLLKGV